MSYSNTFETICNNHLMLLYDNYDQHNEIIINYINKGLETGHICIYASVDPYGTKNSFNISNISYKILNYYENTKEGSLQIINMHACFQSAMVGDPASFEKIKFTLGEILVKSQFEGKRNKVLIITDIPNELIYKKYFQECIEIEKFIQDCYSEWMQNGYSITIVCSYPKSPPSIIKGDSLIHIKNILENLHTKTIKIK
jgi:hypothetical protein